MVLSSEIIEIVTRSSDILCICCIFWTKGVSLVQEGNCWAGGGGGGGGGGMCTVFPTPGSAPGSDDCLLTDPTIRVEGSDTRRNLVHFEGNPFTEIRKSYLKSQSEILKLVDFRILTP